MIRYKLSLENLAGDLESRFGKDDLLVREVRGAITQIVTKKWDIPTFSMLTQKSELTARTVMVESQSPY